MNPANVVTTQHEPAPTTTHLPPGLVEQLIARACARIAPTWPLDRFIAVNPFWGLVGQPLPDVAARLRALSGAELLMPRAWYRQAYREGRLRDTHLTAALEVTGSDASLPSLRALLEQDEAPPSPRARVADVLDARRDLEREPSWRTFVTHSVSQFCAAYFDDGQARLAAVHDGGLYASWRKHALNDRSPGLLMGARDYRDRARELPATAEELVAEALTTLAIPERERESYLWALLLDQNGWASWCAYRRWSARLDGKDDVTLADLLAIRLAWELLLFRLGGPSVARGFAETVATWPSLDESAFRARRDDWVLQTALEIAWREPVLAALPAGHRTERPSAPAVQAVFCIDVRSEVFRRALEAAAPGAQTLGFAGFFGLPIEYQPLGATTTRPQLPGLLAPRLRVIDADPGAPAAEQRSRQLEQQSQLESFKTDALSTFTFVEALGLTYLGKLVTNTLRRGVNERVERKGGELAPNAVQKPRIVGTVTGEPLARDARTTLALGMLRGMSLTRAFARIVLLAGHGSTTCNNPHASGLDCGACSGQAGEVNARVAASLLNDPDVRDGLAARGVRIPESTRFLAALHDTTTDDVELFGTDEMPASHAEDLRALRAWLDDAGRRARAERAPALGLGRLAGAELDRAVRARAADWAEVRPEWGLANNAAFIVAPREHCRHLDLAGRSFLHEYRHQEDEGYGVLELIMTAPMLVTHWINFQYYASTVDNLHYGSGNKVLHNVVGGHLGVFEGNGGDLRIGLPLQSVHDGTRAVHTPLRLSVFIEAPRPAIDGVLAKHDQVRALVENGWLSLFQLDEVEGAVYAKRGAEWRRETPPAPYTRPQVHGPA